LINPLTLINKVRLIRQLNFKSISIIEMISTMISGGIAIILALLGMGVWSIVFYNIFSTIIMLPFMWKADSWRPKLLFSINALKDIFGYGFYVMVQDITVYFTKNIDYLIIGKLLGSEMLGIYTLAFTLTDTFRNRIMSILNNVMFPVYGKYQNDIGLIGKYYLNVIKYNCLAIFPLMAVMFALADPIIQIVFGQQWHMTVFPLKILCLSVMLHCSIGTATIVLKGIGKVKLNFYVNLFKTLVITIPAIVIGIYVRGIDGAAIGIMISKMCSVLVMAYLMKRNINISIKQIVGTIYPFVMGSIVIILVSVILSNFNINNGFILLVIHFIILIACYILVVLPFSKKEIRILLDLIKKKRV
ncbi:MAG: oligosaccharide flippase family protein, partial [Clostridia bacterium]|nr:oligosaccharide flippase family protein [Clostridia bacterium]